MFSEKEQDILGKCYGVFGYAKESLSEIGMYHMMKDSAVEKAKTRALEKLHKAYPGSMMWIWAEAKRSVDKAKRDPFPSEGDSIREDTASIPLGAEANHD